MFRPEEMGGILDGHTLRFVRVVKHSPERVWRAITDERELTEWMRYPVKFEPRVGGRASFFGEDERTSPRIEGKVFIFAPPRKLAFSFFDPTISALAEVGEREWQVLWELDPSGDGCRITFTHRNLWGAVLWGVGEGWHLFIDQLEAYFEGRVGALAAEHERRAKENDTNGIAQYRTHVSRELLAWGGAAAAEARNAIGAGLRDEALAGVDRVELALRQLHRIASQPGVRPDFTIEGTMPVVL